MAKIYDVAHYILQKLPEVTIMKLQKLCYYAQAWTLAWDEQPLFDEDFQAWASGPVCFELYALHKELHKENYGIDTREIKPFAKERLTENEKKNIDIIINDYGDKPLHYLQELTHMERPWKETRGTLPLGTKSNAIIPKELMLEYYSGLLSENT